MTLVESFPGTNRFQLLRRLGMGGMGVVYEALDRQRGVRVALKTLKSVDPHLLLRFKQEFRGLQGLDHPNLVTLLELHSESGHWFFTMELVEGVDFLRWVRGVDGVVSNSDADTDPLGHEVTQPSSQSAKRVSGRFDEAKLRAALIELGEGLARLHGAGKVHRDIKPSNILVKADGRVVILDFGLVTELDRERRSQSDVVGTVDYMAPEQAAGRPVGAPADWYSVGVLVYQALTGIMPFGGPALTVLQDKQNKLPARPSTLVDCPADLDQLCMSLLEIDPAKRPPEEMLLARLGGTASPVSAPGQPAFVGRARELRLLDEALEEVRRGQQVLVMIDGPSGVGKSALVRRFTQRLGPEVVVLSSRYYEGEAVPFRALDSIMDAVSHYLMKLSNDAAAAILPLDAGVLGQQFPSLRGVEAVSRGQFRPAPLDPKELRARVFGAVRELFIRLSRRSCVVLVIDDVQWSDVDSRAVFLETMRGPEGPTLLCIATHRSAPDRREGAERVRGFLQKAAPVRYLEVTRLPPDEARQLAARLLGGSTTLDAEALAEEAEGHPLFIDALVRHALSHGGATKVRIDDALGARIDELEGTARQLCELVALTAGPLNNQDAARAAAVEPPELARALATLKLQNLIRPTRFRDQEAVEPYHDRVRELACARLDEKQLAARHDQLARALEASGHGDPEALFRHFRGAGRNDRALGYCVQSAVRASEVLAFDRAARLYREALAIAPDRKLYLALGDALANAGRGPDAAEAYMGALEGATRDEEWDLKRRIAEQLLRSGRIDAGIAAVRAVLSAVGLTLPKTPRGALMLFLGNRARLRLRGLGFTERAPSDVPAALLSRIDTTWSVSGVLGMVDTIRGAYFQTLHLRLALRAGEPFRVARALGLEVAYSAVSGGDSRKRTAAVLAKGEALAERVGDPYGIAWMCGTAGLAAALEGRWPVGLQKTREAEEIFRNRCGNIAWELSSFQFFQMYSLAYLGRMRELSERVHAYLREAEERGDLYGAAVHRLSLANLVWLCADDVEEAHRKIGEAMAHWSRDGFQLEHFWAMLAGAQAELYSGDAEAAWKRVSSLWKSMESTLLMRVQLTRIEAWQLQGRIALALGSAELLPGVEKNARRIAGEKMPWGTPLARLLEAGVAARRGQKPAALAALEQAIAGLDAADMALYAWAARRQLARLREDGEALAAADEWMRSQAIVHPERMTRMLVPGFG